MAWKCRDRRFVLRGFALLLILAVAAGSAVGQQIVRVAAAADLEPVLPPILEQFREFTGIVCEATYKASAALTMQIQNGAPFDIFFSADMSYPQRLAAAGLTTSPPVTYASGTLVLWTRNDSHLKPSIALLQSPKLQRLAIANPERAPYGRAAVAALRSLGLASTLQPHIVRAENISQTAQFVDTANADAGLISMTSALTPRLRADGTYFAIPRNLYPPIEQGAVVLKNSPNRAAAQKLLTFLLSPAVQAKLSQSGLTPAK